MGNIVILGAGGRLGAALARCWRARGEEVVALDRRALALDETGRLREALRGLEFETVVNCAALTQVDYCENHEEEAFRINGEAPGVIAAVCEERGARCIHIGTDYVFDGEQRRPYAEEDAAVPISVYGASKLAGDEAVQAAGKRHWVVRVSWVFGPDRPSFVDQIISRALKEERLEAVGDKWATPTYTLDAADLLWPFVRKVEGGGVVHLSNAGVCSWQEYGQWAVDCAGEVGLPLKGRKVEALAMADLKAFVAKRPVFSAMETSKLAQLSGICPRSWQEAVRAHVIDQVARGVWSSTSC